MELTRTTLGPGFILELAGLGIEPATVIDEMTKVPTEDILWVTCAFGGLYRVSLKFSERGPTYGTVRLATPEEEHYYLSAKIIRN